MKRKLNPDRSAAAAPLSVRALPERYAAVRRRTIRLCEPLNAEDMVVQSMEDASPAKWHLAHSTWFFETFLLQPRVSGYQPYDKAFCFLFNSYYSTIGARHVRRQRGLLTRPGLGEVMAYRDVVDERMLALIAAADEQTLQEIAPIIEIGLQHEQQHQELLLTDIKHLLWMNPLKPAYSDNITTSSEAASEPLNWLGCDEGLREIGIDEDDACFSFDNERPRHNVWIDAFALADRLVTNQEYLAFIEAGGYQRQELWLDEGWSAARQEEWAMPLYWRHDSGQWREFTLAGEHALDPAAPVCHISLFEADAYARWSEARLPTEAEWEFACGDQPVQGQFLEHGRFHPDRAAPQDPGPIRQCFGTAWEWTGSQYRPYPRYKPPAGALGEYNGKFMSSQFVLRGGACITAVSQVRPTYRNFFHPDKRWQFSGIRLARDA